MVTENVNKKLTANRWAWNYEKFQHKHKVGLVKSIEAEFDKSSKVRSVQLLAVNKVLLYPFFWLIVRTTLVVGTSFATDLPVVLRKRRCRENKNCQGTQVVVVHGGPQKLTCFHCKCRSTGQVASLPRNRQEMKAFLGSTTQKLCFKYPLCHLKPKDATVFLTSEQHSAELAPLAPSLCLNTKSLLL